MQEIMGHARSKGHTIHVTFFNLADAFGSVEKSTASKQLPVKKSLLIRKENPVSAHNHH